MADPNKVYGEQWYFTFTAEAFETQLKLQTAEAEEEKARQEAEAEVGAWDSLECGLHCVCSGQHSDSYTDRAMASKKLHAF